MSLLNSDSRSKTDSAFRRDADIDGILTRLCSLTERVVLFPVRHHSPACARALRDLIRRLRPAAVLVEGPSDFNDRLPELALPHQLPIAIYTWVPLPDESLRGAFYPFCRYSPEWLALTTAGETGAATAFIDLPWADMVRLNNKTTNLYSDAALRRGEYLRRLCQELEVEGFDALWDHLAEQDGGLDAEETLRRTHHFCALRRIMEDEVAEEDLQRESFMAARIQEALALHEGQIFVVTGGYHSLGLLEFLTGQRPALPCEPAPFQEGGGIALTPYSYQDLDSLTGYDAGMPNPGFYDAAWEHGHADVSDLLLQKVAALLRERHQTASTADLIAVRGTAQALATLRGQAHPWRRELMDGIIAALVKDETAGDHPFLAVLHEILRGGDRGRLAEGTPLPPFVADLRAQLAAHQIDLTDRTAKTLATDLTDPAQRGRSRLLHRLALLQLPGIRQTGGVDFSVRDDLSSLTEIWAVQWMPEFEAAAAQGSRYGPTVRAAALARLRELAASATGAGAALILVRAAEAGLASEFAQGTPLHTRLEEAIRSEPDFAEAAAATGHLFHLYQFDEVLETTGLPGLGALLAESWERAVWLVDFIGTTPPDPAGIPDAFLALTDVARRTRTTLALPLNDWIQALRHLESHARQLPLLRGAAAGALWLLRAVDASAADDGAEDADTTGVRGQLRAFADPAVLGDYLTGLFTLARTLASRDAALIRAISETISGFSPDDFLAALPSLRLAFTFFPPREKFDLARVLFGNTTGAVMATRRLAADPVETAANTAFDNRLLATLRRYGLREPAGLSPQPS